MATTILFGNGLNQISHAPSWNELMIPLDSTWQKKGIIPENVPCTIQYDQIELTSSQSESQLLSQLCSILNYTWENEIYGMLANRNDTNYITTNYDLTLESYFSSQIHNTKSRNSTIGERLYNVHTCYYDTHRDVKVWHIHGDVRRSESIILGYDHYCKQISKINNSIPSRYIQRQTNGRTINNKSSGSDFVESWVNLFFTDDIYILGLGLYFSELDLWWLIDKWARYQKNRCSQGEQPSNRVIYLDAMDNTRREITSYKKNFITTLKDFGIIYKPFRASTYIDAYKLCINAIPVNI